MFFLWLKQAHRCKHPKHKLLSVSLFFWCPSVCWTNHPNLSDLGGAYRAPAATHAAVLLPRDPERPKGPERERSEPEKEPARGIRRTREKERKRAKAPLGGAAPANNPCWTPLIVGPHGLWLPTSLLIKPSNPYRDTEPLPLFSRLRLHAASWKMLFWNFIILCLCFLLTWQNFCSRWNFSIGSQWSLTVA